MKINIQKWVMRLASIFTAFVVVVACMTVPTRAAATTYYPSDYFDGFTISGDIKTATYVFDGVMPLHKLVVDGVDKGNNVAGGFSLMVNNASEIRISSYLTGVIAWADKPLPGGGIKISDIMPGAELTFSTKFHFGYTLEGDTTVTDEAVLYTQWAFYAYDSNGNYLGKYLQDSEEKTWVPTGSNGIVVDSTATYTVGANTAYILPFALSRFTIPTGYGANLVGFFDPFTITADINMIYENSQTMQAIKEELKETNNKLDEIISGGSAGDALGDASGEMSDKNDQLSDSLQDYEDSKESLPTTPDNFDDVVDKDAIQDAVDDATQIFDWDASGLTYMFVPMSISLGLAVLFYVVFGKD